MMSGPTAPSSRKLEEAWRNTASTSWRNEPWSGTSLERITPRNAALPGDLVRHEILVTRAAVPEQVLVEIVDEIFLPLVR